MKEYLLLKKLVKLRTELLTRTGTLSPNFFGNTLPIDKLFLYDYYSRKHRDNIFTYERNIVNN